MTTLAFCDSFCVRVREVSDWGSWYWERTFVLGRHHSLWDLALAIEEEIDREDLDHWHGFVFGGWTDRRIEYLGVFDEDARPYVVEHLQGRGAWAPEGRPVWPGQTKAGGLTDEVKVFDVAESGYRNKFEYWFDAGSTAYHQCFIEKRLINRYPTPLKIECVSRREPHPEPAEGLAPDAESQG